MDSMMMVSEAYQLLAKANEMIAQAGELMTNEWRYHRPDCEWKLPENYAANLHIAHEAVRKCIGDAYWTRNALRKFGKPPTE